MSLHIAGTSFGIDWLKQFEALDQQTAARILSVLKFVSIEEMESSLRNSILDFSKQFVGPVGLYAEREIPKTNGVPNPLFTEENGRAYGPGPSAFSLPSESDGKVGSEGITAAFITSLCREFPRKLFNHPGPDMIRKRKIRSCYLITDFIGSGQRVHDYLSGLWLVKSVKSWNSLGLFAINVFTFSATENGVRFVTAHDSSPTVHHCFPCPTIENQFRLDQKEIVKSLCRKYNPDVNNIFPPFGFKNTGALIAFWHGCPNNVPNIFWRETPNWKPLFPKRVTKNFPQQYKITADVDDIAGRIDDLGFSNITKESLVGKNPKELIMLLILLCLRNKRRSLTLLALRSGLSIAEVDIVLKKAKALGWVSSNNRLTDDGYQQTRFFQKGKYLEERIPAQAILYFPSMLRAPIESSDR